MEDSENTTKRLAPPASYKAGVIKLNLPKKPTSKSKQGSGQAQIRKAGSLWYAIYLPQLLRFNEPQQQEYLNKLAAVLENVSSTISFHPQALVCEIRSSLKYFDGIDAIHEKVDQPIKEALNQLSLPDYFFYAACPTITGSLLLARADINALIYRKENLRSVLGKLSTKVLQLDKEQNRRLYNMGVRHLRDIWRLPSVSLRKRFGSELVDLLKKALGEAPEPTRNYLPPPTFSTTYDLPYKVKSLDRLLPLADELISQLCEFLRNRDLSTSHLILSLYHEKHKWTDININLRQANRCHKSILMLLETHFTNLIIPAPIVAMKIIVKKFDDFMGLNEPLLAKDKPSLEQHTDSNLNQFIDLLKARLGAQFINSVQTVAEHIPEYATQLLAYDNINGVKQKPKSAPLMPRPFWLLNKPKQLVLRSGKLYNHKSITIISGPERIESRWWSDADVRRDYYIALEQNGSRLWIYRERNRRKIWYLQGYFS